MMKKARRTLIRTVLTNHTSSTSSKISTLAMPTPNNNDDDSDLSMAVWAFLVILALSALSMGVRLFFGLHGH